MSYQQTSQRSKGGAPGGGRPIKSEDQLRRGVRDAARRPENKRCADCTERLPQYVNLDFSTFVCTACSGIHREFNHRVKSISLANFTEDEVRAIRKGGNQVCNDLYLGKYDRNSDTPEPDGVNVQSRRDFIRNKYVERRWYGTAEDLVREIEERTRKAEERERAKSRLHRRASSRKSFDSSTGSEGTPAVQPITRVLPGVQVQVNKQVPSNDLLDLLSAPSGAPAAVDQSGWGAFQDSQPLQTMMNAVPAAEPQVSSGLAPPPPPPQQAKPGFYLGFPAPPQSQQSPFGALAVQQPQQVVYQQQPQAFSPGFSPFEVQHAPQQQNFGPPALQAPPSFQQFPAAPAVVGTQQQQQPQQLGFTAGFGAFPPPPSGTQAQQLQHARSLSVASTGSLGGGIGAPQVAASHLRVPSQDPFADLSATSAQEVPSFAKGEKCMYQKGGEQHPAVIIKVHLDGGNPPFYSVQLLHTGQEKNTDHHHLLKLANTEQVHENGSRAHPPQGTQDAFAFTNPFGTIQSGAPAAPVQVPQQDAGNPFGDFMGVPPPLQQSVPPSSNPFDLF